MVLIDGQNFRYKIPNWTKLRINYYNLARKLYGPDCYESAVKKMRVIYFDLFQIEKSATEFPSIEAKNNFINELNGNGVKIKTCDVNSLPVKKNGRKDYNMDRFIKKTLDDVADDPDVSHIVLMSGDGHFYQYLRHTINAGKRVTVVSVRESLSPKISNDSQIEVVYFEEVKELLVEGLLVDGISDQGIIP